MLVVEEPIQESIFGPNLRFDSQFGDIQQWMHFRRRNMTTTTIKWLVLRATCDDMILYNKRCPILIILN